MTKQFSVFLATLFALSLIIISGFHGYLLEASVSLFILIAFLLTGLPLSRRIFGSGPSSVVFAFPTGFIYNALILSIGGKFIGITKVSFLIYILFAITLAFFLTKKNHAISSNVDVEAPQSWQIADTLLLFGWMLLTIALVSLPFIHVGMETPHGYAYRAYFNADFFRNLAVAGSLANSGIPPQNPYFSGVTLHYYWFFYVIPSYWKIIFPDFRSDFLMIQFTLVTISIFVSSLFVTLRRFVTSRATLIWLFPIFAIGGSYKGLFILYELHHKHLHFSTFTSWNVEGILRWMWKVPQIDTIFRALLFCPQHLMALTIFLMLIYFLFTQRSKVSVVLFYLMLHASVGFSAIVGAVCVAGYGIVLLYQVARNFREKWIDGVIFNVIGLGFVFLYRNFWEMFILESHQLVLSFNAAIIQHLPLYVILNWGALLVLGVLGIFWGSRKFPRNILVFFLVFSFSLIFMIRLNLSGASDLSLKFGYLVNILFVFFAAAFLDNILDRRKHLVRWLAPVTIILLIPGFLTWSMDAYNAQDISNTHFTTYVSQQDAELYSWMRGNLPKNAIIQQPSYGKGYLNQFVSEIPPFAERAVYLGDKNLSRMYQVPERDIQKRQKYVNHLFQPDSPSRIFAIAHSCKIDYLLFAGKVEQQSSGVRQQMVQPFFKPVKIDGHSVLFEVATNPSAENPVKEVRSQKVSDFR